MPYSNFPPPYHVEGRSSIADLFRPGKRCGLYILHFTNGEVYAGQAVDVTRRYVQHRKVHTDIERISFLRLAQKKLSADESALIAELEQASYSLRNIRDTSFPKGNSDFDIIMPVEEQESWLRNPGSSAEDGTRVTNPDLRRKYTKKFQQLSGLPHSDRVFSFLRSYVHTGIPAFLRGEISFWTCSCLPGYSNPEVRIYSRININWQEVLTVYSEGHSIFVSFHMARTPIEEAFGRSLSDLRASYPRLTVNDHHYKPGGQDQICLNIQGLQAAQDLLKEEDVALAIRLFNLRLMKKGPCNFGRYHCLDLADKLV